MEDLPEIIVLQLPKFQVGSDGTGRSGRLENIAADLVKHPDAGDVVPGSGGISIICVYVDIAARIYLLRCYAKYVKTDLTTNEKRELRQIAAHLKGEQ